VLFDLWETLVIDPPDLGRARGIWRAANVRQVLAADGIDADAGSVETALSRVSELLTEMHDSGLDLDGAGRVRLFIAEFEKVGQRPPTSDGHAALETAICTMTSGFYPLLAAAAVEALVALRARGLRTALVSNAGTTTAPTLRQMLQHHGLANHLDAMVFSDEHRLAKPERRLFEAALEAIGCPAGEAVFVGDSPHNDIAGARAAGMFTVLIGKKAVDGIKPDATIASLAELPGLVGGAWGRLQAAPVAEERMT